MKALIIAGSIVALLVSPLAAQDQDYPAASSQDVNAATQLVSEVFGKYFETSKIHIYRQVECEAFLTLADDFAALDGRYPGSSSQLREKVASVIPTVVQSEVDREFGYLPEYFARLDHSKGAMTSEIFLTPTGDKLIVAMLNAWKDTDQPKSEADNLSDCPKKSSNLDFDALLEPSDVGLLSRFPPEDGRLFSPLSVLGTIGGVEDQIVRYAVKQIDTAITAQIDNALNQSSR